MNIRPVIAYRLTRMYMRRGQNFTTAVRKAWENSK